MVTQFGVFEPPAPSQALDAIGQRPFFSDPATLRKDERDEAILTGKLPPGTGELREPDEDRFAAWLAIAGL